MPLLNTRPFVSGPASWFTYDGSNNGTVLSLNHAATFYRSQFTILDSGTRALKYGVNGAGQTKINEVDISDTTLTNSGDFDPPSLMTGRMVEIENLGNDVIGLLSHRYATVGEYTTGPGFDSSLAGVAWASNFGSDTVGTGIVGMGAGRARVHGRVGGSSEKGAWLSYSQGPLARSIADFDDNVGSADKYRSHVTQINDEVYIFAEPTFSTNALIAIWKFAAGTPTSPSASQSLTITDRQNSGTARVSVIPVPGSSTRFMMGYPNSSGTVTFRVYDVGTVAAPPTQVAFKTWAPAGHIGSAFLLHLTGTEYMYVGTGSSTTGACIILDYNDTSGTFNDVNPIRVTNNILPTGGNLDLAKAIKIDDTRVLLGMTRTSGTNRYDMQVLKL